MGRYGKNVAAPAMPDVDDARRFMDHARKLVDDEVSLRFGRSASDLTRLAEVMRTASARLDGSFAAPYFEGAANQIDRAADMLKQAKTGEMVDAVQRFARTHPLWFLGSALALGIGAGRFLRSSALPALPGSTSTSTSEPSVSNSARKTARKQKPRSTISTTRDES